MIEDREKIGRQTNAKKKKERKKTKELRTEPEEGGTRTRAKRVVHWAHSGILPTAALFVTLVREWVKKKGGDWVLFWCRTPFLFHLLLRC